MASIAFVANAGDGTVSTFELSGDGDLRRLSVSPVGPGCATLAVDPERRRLYVGVKSDPPTVVSCEIQADGAVTPVSRREVPSTVHYLSLTPDGTALLAASYGGGFGASMPVDDHGVGEVVTRIDQPNMHCSVVGPGGRTAYFVSLGADVIVQCALDGAHLTPLDPPTVAAPPGSGPRHLVLSRDGSHAYVMTEFSGEILHFARNVDGTLTPAGGTAAYAPELGLRHSRFGADPTAEHLIWGADLHLSLDERVCWASERSGSTLATVPLGDDGRPDAAIAFTPTEPQPRGFAVSPDGRFLLCAGERSTTVSLFEVEPDGRLAQRTRAETGRGANWIRFLDR